MGRLIYKASLCPWDCFVSRANNQKKGSCSLAEDRILLGASRAVQALVVALALPKPPSNLLQTASDILRTLSKIQQALLCFMRRMSEYPKWENVQTFYVEHIQEAATLSEMYLILDEILNTVYWTRMIRKQSLGGKV